MTEPVNKTNEENKKNDKVFPVMIIIALLIVLAAVCAFAYAKYISSGNGVASANTANMICEMDISETSGQTHINPYCEITVRNYKGSAVSQTSVDFTLQAVAKDGVALPDYVWMDSDGTIIARSGNDFPTQSLGHTTQESKTYKIVFINSGNLTAGLEAGQPLTRYVDFNLVAVQKR